MGPYVIVGGEGPYATQPCPRDLPHNYIGIRESRLEGGGGPIAHMKTELHETSADLAPAAQPQGLRGASK